MRLTGLVQLEIACGVICTAAVKAPYTKAVRELPLMSKKLQSPSSRAAQQSRKRSVYEAAASKGRPPRCPRFA
jgi:hypothetical protein